MEVLAWITGVLAALGYGMAGVAKLIGQQMMQDAAKHLGFSRENFQVIGLAEVVGAVGLILGTAIGSLEWIGIGAGLGLILVAIGAVMNHRRVGDDGRAIMPAVVLGALSLIAVIALTLR